MLKLVSSGAIANVERDDLMVCNPLGVVRNSAHKPRLIVDLRYVNKHLRSCKFNYEDIQTAADLFSKGDWFFIFDSKSGYHHIEIFPQHRQFLGFSLFYKDQLRYFHFTVLLLACPRVLISLLRFKEHLSNTGEVKASEY